MAYRRGSFKITTTNPQTKQAEQSEGTYWPSSGSRWTVLEDRGGFRSPRVHEHEQTPQGTTNPIEPATDAVTRTAREILAALGRGIRAKVASYYAPPDAVLATPGRPAVRGGEVVRGPSATIAADPNFKLSVSDGEDRMSLPRVTWPTAESRQSHVYEPADQQVENAAATAFDRLQEAGGRKLEGGGRFRG
jgi:hypothetical protein